MVVNIGIFPVPLRSICGGGVFVPNIKSAKKRVLVSKAQNEMNKAAKSLLKTNIKKFQSAAETAVKSDTANASQTRFTDHEREIFRKNAAMNKKTIEAAKAYLDLLKQHEDIIRGKLREAERVREVAQSSWNTVSLASDLKEIVKTNHEAFEALLSLELPPLALFDDSALQAEFDAITRKLRKE